MEVSKLRGKTVRGIFARLFCSHSWHVKAHSTHTGHSQMSREKKPFYRCYVTFLLIDMWQYKTCVVQKNSWHVGMQKQNLNISKIRSWEIAQGRTRKNTRHFYEVCLQILYFPIQYSKQYNSKTISTSSETMHPCVSSSSSINNIQKYNTFENTPKKS